MAKSITSCEQEHLDLRYLFLTSLIMAILGGVRLQAQPDAPRAEQLRSEIAAISKKLISQPSNPELRERRGDLYVGLYRSAFDERDLGKDLSARMDLVSRAITDYTHVMWVNHGPSELELKRGTAYALRWRLSTLNWREATRGNRDPKWNDLVDWEDRQRQRAAFRKFITNRDFELAIADLDRSSRGRNDPAVEVAAELVMGRLYLMRTRIFPYAASPFTRALAEKSAPGYSVWDDYENAIHHLFTSDNPSIAPRGPLQFEILPFELSESGYNNALYEKILLAIAFGRDEDAIAFRDNRLSWVDTVPVGNEFSCKYYTTAYETEVRLSKFDDVIDGFGIGDHSDPPLECAPAHEPLGDAYFAKGDHGKAIGEYTIAAGPARVYLKRAKAYLKLGQKDMALADIASFLDKNTDGLGLAEAHLLRASILREMGDDKAASRDEIVARNLKLANDNLKLTGLVYGTLLLPDGKPATEADAAYVTINYRDGSIERTYADARGRFAVSHLKPQPFYITASAGESFRSRIRRFPTLRTHIGPLRVRLTYTK